ncbi:hypothetical protein EDD70_2305 [Hydrogenoanaerobacterium saccharovorans]|uniref:Uncharacterized protein n=1 Tax=Hydrogenoanaerobacterium saccharovorans TaxID=474960 RepID=A0A1H8CW41_9FIRM|nr:hypothetical protein [Hydrogenoanaerobacterium saccharovorans]RPF43342.1 hypothetical protein EDD70_2305 [Hydrogenoanaerobacterium saccharovorans]SEM99109.1 hypothetical protein SAMN05216180_2363 [Hydrogenoanaerobacterium saccharovorans]
MSDKNKKNIAPQSEQDDDFFDFDTIASATECTGLIPTPPLSDEEAESYTDIYSIPKPGVMDEKYKSKKE